MPFCCFLTLFFPQITKGDTYYRDISELDDIHYFEMHIYEEENSVYSIFDQPEVTFVCENMSIQDNTNINLVIYDQPTIIFESIQGICHFNNISVIGKPKFLFNNSKVYTNTLVFLDEKIETDIIYKKLITGQEINQNKDTLICSDGELGIMLSEYINISCINNFNDSFYRIIEYDSFFNYNILVNTSVINFSESFEGVEGLKSRLALISKSLILQRKVKFFFNDFLEAEDVSILSNFFDSNMISLWIKYTCRRYSEKCRLCLFYSFSYREIYKDLDDYFRNITQNTKWRQICNDTEAYLKYQNEEIPHEVIELNNFFSLVFICSLIAAILLLFFSLCAIGYCKFRKDNKKRIYPKDQD